MSRQILTFVIVFLGIFLLMKTCMATKPKPGPAAAEPVAEEKETYPLADEASGTTVLLARDGSVVSVRRGESEWVRPVPATRRTFHLLRSDGRGTHEFPLDGWSGEQLEGNARRFTWADGDLVVTKVVRLAEGGGGLDLELKVQGGGAAVTGLVLSGASGVMLDEPDAAERSFSIVQVRGQSARVESFEQLVQEREDNPNAGYALNVNLTSESQDHVERLGVLGRAAYVALESLPRTSELYVDAYRAARGEAETGEIETWVDLVAPEGAYEGRFTLRWTPRAEAPAELQRDGEMRPENVLVLEDDTFLAELTDRGAALRALYLKKFSTVAGEEPGPDTWIPILRGGVRAGERALTLQAARYGGNPGHDTWDAERAPDGRSILFTLTTPLGWTLTKRVSLPDPGRYTLGVEIGAARPDSSNATDFQYTLVGPAGSYIADAYRGIYGGDRPAAFFLEREGGGNHEETIEKLVDGDELRRAYGDDGGLLKALGTRGTYFCVALLPEERSSPDGRPEGSATLAIAKAIKLSVPVERADGEPSQDSMLARISCTAPLEGGAVRERYRLYAGPNELATLRELGIEDAINFGWFGIIGKALMWLMKLYESFLGSYGIAILLMTLTVRALLLPVSFKTQLSMQRYSKRIGKIKPLLDELQKKHASNPQKLNAERMKLMREHGVGLPLGCLTIFFQIPIWFALFQALRVEFSLRHQPFLWANDLSMPDHLFALSFWPNWFNLLPILMLVLWVVQQRITPTPGSSDDPQVKMQMKMMRFMPFVFFFMLYNYAAALALYMCMSSTWSIVESKLVRRAIAKLD